MGFKTDTDVVKKSVKTLRHLLEECREMYSKEIPDSSVDKGLTHNELQKLCQNIKTTCRYLGELINNSIRFLGESSDMFDTSDQESAAAIDITVGGVAAGAVTIALKSGIEEVISDIEYNNKQAQLMESMLQQNSRIDTSKYDNLTYYDYYDSNGVYRQRWGLYRNTDGCTWYAYNRYQEMNPEIGSMFSGDGGGGNASNWIYSIDKNKFDVKDTTNYENIRSNTIAVSTQPDAREPGIRASGNHVVYVEAVKDGYVYYTDGSYGYDESTFGYVNKVPIDIFAKDYEYVIEAK